MEILSRVTEIVLVETDENKLDSLQSAFQALPSNREKISSIQSLTAALEKTALEDLRLYLIGDTYGFEAQKKFIQNVLETENGVIIALSSSHEKNLLLKYLQTGAHGILLYPFEFATFKQVISSALEVYREQQAIEPKNQEQATNLPWLLETISYRLERIAASFSHSGPMSANQIQEALLKAFSSSS